MENNKSPGLDGLSTNFYKHFWPIIGPELTRIYNYAYDHGHHSHNEEVSSLSFLKKEIGPNSKTGDQLHYLALTTKY